MRPSFHSFSYYAPLLIRYGLGSRMFRIALRNPPPHEHKVLAGVRTLGGQDFLLAKFAWRGGSKTRVHFKTPAPAP